MSRVDDLIKELCPNGVEFKRIGELGIFSRGGGIQKKHFTDTGVPAVHYGQIYTHYGIWAEETNRFVAAHDAEKAKRASHGDVLIADASENDEDLGSAVAWLGDHDVVLSNHLIVFTPESGLDPKYVSYFLRSSGFQSQKRKIASGTKVRSLSAKGISTVEIPVPPLEIQQEIARILDKFTQLEAELEAELEARRKQYAYYLEKLGGKLRTKFSTTSLGDVGDWVGGNTPSKSDPKYWENGEILWVSSKDMKASSITDTKYRVTDRAISEGPARVIPKDAVVVVTRSSILERTLPVATLAMEATINQDIKAILPSEDFDHRYIYFAIKWSSDEILRTIRKSGGSVTSLDTKKLKDFKIPAPPLEEQRRVVAILDRFDALVNDISTGLPAEIAARRKQYEYYRDKLLSFQPAAAAQQ